MDKKEIFKQFIESNEVLVVDKNSGSRNRLLKIVSDLGAKRHMIHTASGLVEAEAIIKEKKISLVLSDYFVAGGSGFDLFKMMREKEPNRKLIQILVTANISQTAVAKAAEEDVDSFIIKPYTLQSIQENLISTVVAKVQPSQYMVKIDEGKKAMAEMNLDMAMELFQEATKLHAKPALALFYMGQVEYMRKYLDEAKGNYQNGLAFNSIHFKCLIGLFELFMKEKQYNEAYGVVKKIAKYFPANPDRLSQIIRLAVQTENYSDMQFYYEVFTTLEERTPILVNYIGAGMFVSGKFCLKNNDVEGALRYFDNIAVSCAEYTKFVRAMITALIQHDKGKEAEKYLSRFPPSAKDEEDYKVSDFLVTAKVIPDKSHVVKKGLDLYNQKIRDLECMKALINAMVAAGYKEEKVSKYRNELTTLWPEEMTA